MEVSWGDTQKWTSQGILLWPGGLTSFRPSLPDLLCGEEFIQLLIFGIRPDHLVIVDPVLLFLGRDTWWVFFRLFGSRRDHARKQSLQ